MPRRPINFTITTLSSSDVHTSTDWIMYELRLLIELLRETLQIDPVRRYRTIGIDMWLTQSLKITTRGLPEIQFLMDFTVSAWPALQIVLSPSITY